MKIVLIFLLILCTSCFSRKDKNVVNVNTIDEKIYNGMKKERVIETLGYPKDSLQWETSNNIEYYFLYDTNDLFGYRLTITFNNKDEIVFYRID